MKASIFPFCSFWVAVGVLAAVPASSQPAKTPLVPAVAPKPVPNGTLDSLVFGDGSIETAHQLKAPLSEVMAGALGQKARRALPRNPVSITGGDLTFSMKVDAVRRNYFSIKLWGGEAGDAGRLLLYMPVKNVDYQVGYRHEGDYLPLSASSGKAPLPGRFYYSTTLLPLEMTRGKTSVTLKIVSTGRLNALGAGAEATGGNYQYNMKAKSRGIYRAYTHTEPLLVPVGEVQGTAPTTQVRPAPGEEVLAPTGAFTNGVNSRIKALLSADVGAKNFTPADVLYLARSYSVPGLVSHQNPAVMTKVAAMIDALAGEYALNPEGAASVGGDESWGGRFGALGGAIHHLKAPLQPLWTVPIPLGNGATKVRRAAWADMLWGSREWGRTNRRGVSSETIAGDISVYRANQGLLALGDARAFPEPSAQRYLREAVGLTPWLGNDLPNNGHEMRYGPNFSMVTAKGLTREWGYVGPARGEMASLAIEMFEMTGNPDFRAQAIKMMRARAPFRRPAIEQVGSNRYTAMEGIGLLSWRGVNESDGEGFSSHIAYADRTAAASGLRVAAATLDPILVGYAKQMLADNQFFSSLVAGKGNFNSLSALEVLGDFRKIKAAQASARLPMTQGQPNFAWADEESGVMALKEGNQRLWVAPYWQNKTGTGINGIGRFHFSTPRYDQIGVLETVPQFRARGIFIRPANFIDKPEAIGLRPANSPLQAYGGERLPLGITPSGARDDAPFRGQVDFYAFRFGPYLIGMNRTPNRNFTLKTPAGFSSSPDLFSGKIRSGPMQVAPNSTMALRLDQTIDRAPIPIAPLAVTISSGSAGAALEWNTASGASTYTVKRAPAYDGPYESVKSGLTSTTFTDSQAGAGGTYFYTVVAQNKNGESYESMKVASFAAFDIERTVAPAGGLGGGSALGGGSRPGGAGGVAGGTGADAPQEGDPLEMLPFVLEGNTEDGVPTDPGPKPPSAPSS